MNDIVILAVNMARQTPEILRREEPLKETPQLPIALRLTDNHEVEDVYTQHDKSDFLSIKTRQPKSTRIRYIPFETKGNEF